MTQCVPPEAWRRRYAFGTGDGYELHVAQLARELGGPDVQLDGQAVFGWTRVGDFEVVDWDIEPGPHVAVSDGPFSLTHYAWSNGLGRLNRWAAYALPGGFAGAGSPGSGR